MRLERKQFVYLDFCSVGGRLAQRHSRVNEPVTDTCFLSANRSGGGARVACADAVRGHHPKLVLHPGVELHCHGGLHASCHWVWI